MSTTRSCVELQLALMVFRGSPGTDLPDDIALHIESCPCCLSSFDELFPPVRLATPARTPQPRLSRGAVSMAAIGLLALGMGAPTAAPDPLAMLLPGESALTFDEMLASDPECPLIPGEADPPVCADDDGEWM
jgi:hypothetical protein